MFNLFPTHIINSWDNLKVAFTKKYYLPFKQNDNEHIATTWEKIKLFLEHAHHMELMDGKYCILYIMAITICQEASYIKLQVVHS